SPGGCIDVRVGQIITQTLNGNSGHVLANSGGLIQMTGLHILLENNSYVRANGAGTIDLCSGTRPEGNMCSPSACTPGSGTVLISMNPGDGDPGLSAEGFGEITVVGGNIDVDSPSVVSTNNPNDGGFAGFIRFWGAGLGVNVDPGATIRSSAGGNNGF